MLIARKGRALRAKDSLKCRQTRAWRRLRWLAAMATRNDPRRSPLSGLAGRPGAWARRQEKWAGAVRRPPRKHRDCARRRQAMNPLHKHRSARRWKSQIQSQVATASAALDSVSAHSRSSEPWVNLRTPERTVQWLFDTPPSYWTGGRRKPDKIQSTRHSCTFGRRIAPALRPLPARAGGLHRPHT